MELARRCHAEKICGWLRAKGTQAATISRTILPCGHSALTACNTRIRGIDVSAAKSLPGVLAVLTGKDAAADGIGAIPHSPDWQGPPDAELLLPDGFDVFLTDNTPLPAEIVRYVGEGVAMVVAETAACAADAAELIEVDYEPYPR